MTEEEGDKAKEDIEVVEKKADEKVYEKEKDVEIHQRMLVRTMKKVEVEKKAENKVVDVSSMSTAEIQRKLVMGHRQ